MFDMSNGTEAITSKLENVKKWFYRALIFHVTILTKTQWRSKNFQKFVESRKYTKTSGLTSLRYLMIEQTDPSTP